MRHRSRDRDTILYRDTLDYRSRNNDRRHDRRSPVQSSSNQHLLRTKVFVGNIHDSVTSFDLRKIFEPYGHIIECDKIPTKDYAFVHFETAHEAERAVKMVRDMEIKGRRLIVQSSINSKPPQINSDLSSDEYQSKSSSSRVKSSISVASRKRYDRSRSPIFRAYSPPPPPRSDPYSSSYHSRRPLQSSSRDYNPPSPPPPPPLQRMPRANYPEYYDRNDLAHELLEARHPVPSPPSPPPPPPLPLAHLPTYYSNDRISKDYHRRSPIRNSVSSYRSSVAPYNDRYLSSREYQRFQQEPEKEVYRDVYRQIRRPPSPPLPPPATYRETSRDRHRYQSSRYESTIPQPPPTPPLPYSRTSDFDLYRNGDYKTASRRDRDRVKESNNNQNDKQHRSKRRKSE